MSVVLYMVVYNGYTHVKMIDVDKYIIPYRTQSDRANTAKWGPRFGGREYMSHVNSRKTYFT